MYMYMYVHVRPEVKFIQLHVRMYVAVQGGSVFVRGRLQLTREDGSALVRGWPCLTR